jgi:hypothetical protein
VKPCCLFWCKRVLFCQGPQCRAWYLTLLSLTVIIPSSLPSFLCCRKLLCSRRSGRQIGSVSQILVQIWSVFKGSWYCYITTWRFFTLCDCTRLCPVAVTEHRNNTPLSIQFQSSYLFPCNNKLRTFQKVWNLQIKDSDLTCWLSEVDLRVLSTTVCLRSIMQVHIFFWPVAAPCRAPASTDHIARYVRIWTSPPHTDRLQGCLEIVETTLIVEWILCKRCHMSEPFRLLKELTYWNQRL